MRRCFKSCSYPQADVHICVLTNGEYCADEDAVIRSAETCTAMAWLGISETNIHFLGYADTGMKKDLSFLCRLWHNNANTVFLSRWGRTETWNPRDDYAMKKCGEHSPYTRSGFLHDICDVIEERLRMKSLSLPPVITTATIAIQLVKAKHPNWNPKLYEYLVHTENEFSWPARSGGIFTCPDDIHSLGLNWSVRECRALSSPLLQTNSIL